MHDKDKTENFYLAGTRYRQINSGLKDLMENGKSEYNSYMHHSSAPHLRRHEYYVDVRGELIYVRAERDGYEVQSVSHAIKKFRRELERGRR